MHTILFPLSLSLQHRSISSLCAKNRPSKAPASQKSFDRINKQAPVAHIISMIESYCPLSSSITSKILPRQKGYPNLSTKPPAAPAYSNSLG